MDSPIDDTIAEAKAQASQLPAIPIRKLTMFDLEVGSLDVESWLQVDRYGLHLDVTASRQYFKWGRARRQLSPARPWRRRKCSRHQLLHDTSPGYGRSSMVSCKQREADGQRFAVTSSRAQALIDTGEMGPPPAKGGAKSHAKSSRGSTVLPSKRRI
jgi:hypothetical protein